MDNDLSINTIILTNIIASTAKILSNGNILLINNNCLNFRIKIILLKYLKARTERCYGQGTAQTRATLHAPIIKLVGNEVHQIWRVIGNGTGLFLYIFGRSWAHSGFVYS
jgi:hypothetical protein